MSIVDQNGSITDPYRNFIAVSRYARWLEDQQRRETWEETVDRYVDNVVRPQVTSVGDFDLDEMSELIEDIRKAILNHDVMPSMRGLMVAGPALERENLAMYNCSFIAVNSPRVFDEALYILMNGVGLGFSVEQEHVAQLPVVNEHFESSNSTIVVADSKAGWARGLRELIAMLYAGQVPMIDVTNIRPAGARLKTFGGRASGPQPLINLFDFTISTFKKAAGRKLSSVECHDIMCKIGEVVVVGGVRRSALISLSDLGSYEMATAKTGAWWEANPQRALANNSAVYHKKPALGEFLREWINLYESRSGERGIFNRQMAQSNKLAPRRDTSKILGTNPCGEINLRHGGLCNLTEVVIKRDDDLELLKKKIEIATILGTIQSSYTDFKYLRKFWRTNAEEERLLGVSLTGQFGNELMSGKLGMDNLKTTLEELRSSAISVNKKWAKHLGINQSVAITTVKPSGTVSQLTGSSSGMHPWHSDYYLRSVRGDNKDPLTQFLMDAGIPNEPDVMNESTTVFYFPVKAPDGSVVRTEISAIDHLEVWRAYKLYWTEHNPSVTISVKEDEWISVAEWVYNNWDDVGGISFLPYSDHTYKQAPYQEVDSTAYNQFVADSPSSIDWSLLQSYEFEDNTSGTQALACTSNACELVDISASEEK